MLNFMQHFSNIYVYKAADFQTNRDVTIRAHIRHTQSQYPVSHLSVSADSYFHYSTLFRMILFLFFVLIVPFMFLSPLTLIIMFVLEISLTCKVYVVVCEEYGIHCMTYELKSLK
jgi:hypothetical protein